MTALELSQIIKTYGDDYLSHHKASFAQRKVMHHIVHCRTAQMGGHRQKCDHCGFEKNAYNSCGDRHCPKCRTLPKERWLAARRSELLPTGYFHLVFTLPHDLNLLIHSNPRLLLGNLFEIVNDTLQRFANDPKWRLNGQLGFIAVLHTWSQTLIDHFHLHCLIPAGALAADRSRWVPARKNYLFRVESLARQFRKSYLEHLQQLYETDQLHFYGECAGQDFSSLIAAVRKKRWIVYAKAPFAGPQQVLDYLGRYTHRVAISNHRLLSIDKGQISFTYKDRSAANRTRIMAVTANEFIRRYLLHVLPRRFVKIRYFGFLFHRNKQDNIALIRKLLDCHSQPVEPAAQDARQLMLRIAGIDIKKCPHCRKGQLMDIYKIPKGSHIRDPPGSSRFVKI